MTNDDYKRIAWTLRRYAKMHNTPPFGREIEGEVDLELTAAEAIEELVELSKNTSDSIRVDTPFGTLVARASSFGDAYPGIWIELARGAADMALCLVEYTDIETDLPQEGHLITRVYGDGLQDEYTDRIVHENTEEYFNMED